MPNRSSERPTPREGVSAYPLDDELVLYDPDAAQAYVLNVTGARIWALCDGSRSIAQVARALASTYQVAYRSARADVREFVDALDKAGLLTRGS